MAGLLAGSFSIILGSALIFASGNPEDINFFFPAVAVSMIGLLLASGNAKRSARGACFIVWVALFTVSLAYTLATRTVTAGVVLWVLGYLVIFVVPCAPFPHAEALLRKINIGGQE